MGAPLSIKDSAAPKRESERSVHEAAAAATESGAHSAPSAAPHFTVGSATFPEQEACTSGGSDHSPCTR
jgi:hypothetical protein